MTTTPAERIRGFLGAWQQRIWYDRDTEIAWQVDLTGEEHTLMVADLEALLDQLATVRETIAADIRADSIPEPSVTGLWHRGYNAGVAESARIVMGTGDGYQPHPQT